MKQCSKCKKWKDKSEFHKSKHTKDGYYPQCKVCKNKKTSEYAGSEAGKEYQRNWQRRFRKTEQGKKFYRDYAQSEKGKATIKRFEQSEKGKAKARRNRQSDKYKNRHRVANEKYRAKNPEKVKAQSIVQYAVVTEKLPRPTSLGCTYCENQASHYHHHNGYDESHWLDVVPTCAKCHSAIHIPERTRRVLQRGNQDHL